MSDKNRAQTKKPSSLTVSFTPMQTNVLQCKCNCGGAPGVDGFCAQCRSKQLTGENQLTIQSKLTIGQPGDKYEQEADRVADQVMRMPDSQVQRQAEPNEEEEDTLQTKPIAGQITPLVQRQVEAKEEEEEPVQTKQGSSLQVQRQEDEDDIRQE